MKFNRRFLSCTNTGGNDPDTTAGSTEPDVTTSTTTAATTSLEILTTGPYPDDVELIIDEKLSKKGLVTFAINFREAGTYSLSYYNKDGILSDAPVILDEEIVVEDDDPEEMAILHTESFEDMILPPDASGILAKNLETNEEHSLPFGSKYALTDKKFVFAALSDVHYNQNQYPVYLDIALDYIDGLNVDFVAIAGDLSTSGEVDALKKFNREIEGRSYPVYTVTGNHDVSAVNDGTWIRYINQDIYDSSNTEIVNVAENKLDFVYRPRKLGGNVFVFLSQVRSEYGNADSHTILDDSQLIWLENVLEEYKDETVYLFFHTFLCGPDGEGHTGVGNFSTGKYKYGLYYTYGAKDEVKFRNLMKEYKNVLYFSGHSHWMFEMEVYNPITNYSNFDGDYAHMIHVPSVTEPRYVGPNDSHRTSMNGKSSQGWIIYDYGDAILMLPIEFITGEYLYEYMEIIHTGKLAD